MAEKTVIVTFSMAGKIRALPKIKKLIGGDSNLVIVGQELNLPEGLNGNIVPKRFDDYLSEEIIDRIENDILRFMGELPKSSPKFAEAVSHNGISLWEVSSFHISDFFFDVFKYIKVAEKMIEIEKPDKLVVVGDKGPFLFWLNIESGLAERRNLRQIALWIANSRRATIGEEAIYQAASLRGITALRIPLGPGSYLRHYFIFHLLPPLFRSFLRFCDFRRRIGQKLGRAEVSTPARNKICLFVSSRNMSLTAAPVVEELKKDKSNEVLVIRLDGPASNFTRKALEEEGIPYRTYETYINGEVRRKASKGAKFVRQKWSELENDKDFQKLISYDGALLWSIVKEPLSYIFSILLPEAVKHIEVINHLIGEEKPDILILLHELSPVERAAAFVAHSRGIPTLDIQAMACGRREPRIPISTDRMTVSGEIIKQLVIQRKGEACKERLVITGDPRFEYMLQTMKGFNKEEFCSQLDLKGGQTTILFTSTPVQLSVTAEIREQLIYCVYNAIKALPDKQFVVKLHPGEGFELHHKLKAEMKVENVIITKDANLYHLFEICDLVMTFLSTTSLEAMIMDKPVIEVNLTGQPDELPYVESGAAIGVYREEDLVPAINDVLYNKEVRARLAEKRKEFVYNYAYLQDGQAAKRVADLVMQMIQESKRSKSGA